MTAPSQLPAQPQLTPGLAADLAGASLALAQRFSAGATMWCVAPAFTPHAQHIAVEFVHPVVVGKRALPAVALTGADLVDQVRISARSGDIVIAVARADDPDVNAVMRRAPAWGVTTIWIGNGARPAVGAADHVLWVDDPDPRLPATGHFVLLYHLLWELTHVCFEHPGLLTDPSGSPRCWPSPTAPHWCAPPAAPRPSTR
jgi:phosphoheptose isomerase